MPLRKKSPNRLIAAARRLRSAMGQLVFPDPVVCVYNPLDYAWAVHELYLRRYGCAPKRVVFLGMNPGPFGMVQTGVPFGEVSAVRDWLQLRGEISPPGAQHPRRPVEGFRCPRSEVSGQRLWGLFADRFGSADAFFKDHFVLNYCPLAFVEESGRNLTPDKLPGRQKSALFTLCDEHLLAAITALEPEWVVGIGEFAVRRAQHVFGKGPPAIGRILHPSPASPMANRNWKGKATRQLEEMGVWPPHL